MQRRAAVLLLVLVTVIGGIVLHATAGRSVAGIAVGLPSPVAPEPGSCLTNSRPAGWLPVDCAQLHTAEVALGWPASAGNTAGHYQDCVTAGRAYLGDRRALPSGGTGHSDWAVPEIMSSTVLVSGPGPTSVRGWSWQACVVRPIALGGTAAGYRGRLQDERATGALPAELRRCFNRRYQIIKVDVICSARHTGETLAARPLRIFGSTTAVNALSTSPQVLAECRGIAGATTAAADPTYGGRLQVVVDLHATGMGFVTTGRSVDSAADSYVLYQASCALQTSSGRELSGSVVGLGTGPLPLQ